MSVPPKPKKKAVTVEIYGLLDPVDGSLRYIGKSTNSSARLKAHLREVRRKTPVYCWIESLRRVCLTPKLVTLSIGSEESWREREITAIADARSLPENKLLNVARGGDEPYCPTHIRAENGRNSAIARTSTPFKARVFFLKRQMGRMLSSGYVTQNTKEKLKLAARRRPDLFGNWANL